MAMIGRWHVKARFPKKKSLELLKVAGLHKRDKIPISV
jgi:hypothetical protein